MSQQLSLFADLSQPVSVTKGKPPQAKPAPSMLRQAVAEYLPTVNALPATERPRARLEHYGSGALATSELLAVLLGTPQQVHDAERLLASLEGLPGIAQANWTELCDQPGIGPTCTAALELGRRLLVAAPSDKPMVRSPADAANMLMPEMGLLDQEELRVVLLDTRNRVIAIPTVYRGSFNSAAVRIGEVFMERAKTLAGETGESYFIFHQPEAWETCDTGWHVIDETEYYYGVSVINEQTVRCSVTWDEEAHDYAVERFEPRFCSTRHAFQTKCTKLSRTSHFC